MNSMTPVSSAQANQELAMQEDKLLLLGQDQYTDDGYNLEEMPFKDSSTLATEYFEIKTKNQTDLTSRNEDGEMYEIEHLGSMGDIIDPRNVYFIMEACIRNEVVADLTADTINSTNITSNVLKCFKNLKLISSNGEIIDDIDHIGIADSMSKLCFTSKDWQAGTAMGWYPNLKSAMSVFSVADRSAGNADPRDENAILRHKRIFNLVTGGNRFTKSAYYVFQLPIFLRECQKYIKALPFTLQFTRGSDDHMFEVIQTVVAAGVTAAQKCRFTIKNLSMFIPVIRPTLQMSVDYERMVKNDYLLQYSGIQFERLLCSNSSEINRTLKTLSSVPKFVIIGLQNINRTNPTIANVAHPNPDIFDNMNVQRMEILVNGQKRVPYNQFENDWSVDKYHIQYMNFLKVSNSLHNYDGGSIVSYEMFKNMYPLFCFDLRSSHSANIPEPNKLACKLDLAIKFPASPGHEFYLNVLYIFDNVLMIKGLSGIVRKIYGN